ncbi:ABC-type lipoprotein export system ATPase subunit [Microbacterium aurum]|nr:ABC-type lipoprotein export system ATPase subunit [Microbacterium aurum]
MTALAGPSGSGKSTLLDLIGLTYAPTAGTITFTDDAGQVAVAHGQSAPPGSRWARVSWILQSNIVLSGRSVLDNVAVAQLTEGTTTRQAYARARRSLQRVGLAERAKSRVNELSGGEVQRVTVARCLTSSAELILADEPTGQLDASNTELVASALRELATDGRIVIVATHDERVMGQCDATLRLR